MHVVGWEQSYDPIKEIDEDLTKSESGLTFQGAHPLVTLDNVLSIMPEDFIFQYPEWSATEAYKKGDKVRHSNNVWIAVANNTNEEPNGLTEDYWEAYNFASDYIRNITRNGVTQTIQTFAQIKGLAKETKNLLERRTFFDGAGRIRETIQNTHKLVGFEIMPIRSMGVTMKIERVGLQMAGATGTIRLYLFHSSQIEPIKHFDVEFTKTNGGFQWFNLKDCYLPYISNDNNAGGVWFLCYNQDDLPFGMEAVNMSKDWSKEPCATCTGYSLEHWREITKYMQVTPFMFNAPETFAEFPELWDIAMTMYTTTQNYGLNCEVSVGCDITDFIIREREIFANVIQKQVASNVLRTLAMNPNVRVNRNQVNASRTDILYEIDGNTAGLRPNGLGNDLKKAYEALRIDTQGIDRICLSCNNHGVKYRTT